MTFDCREKIIIQLMPVYVLRNFVFGRRQLGLSTLSGYRLDYRSVVPAVASVGFRYRLSSPHLFFFFLSRHVGEVNPRNPKRFVKGDGFTRFTDALVLR